jgi:hypothetical protein
MKNYLISERQFKKIVEQVGVLESKWNKLSDHDKVFVVELAKVMYPEKTKLIKEDKWYNTVGDIAGIFDPTGIVDLVNGISYWRQGDKLFAILSWVSAVPYMGDLIAKPVIGVMKAGGSTAKAFKSAAIAGDAVKMGKAAKEAGGPIGKFVEKSPSWGEKLMSMLRASAGKVPFLGKGLVNTIGEYVSIFGKASKEMKVAGKGVKGVGAISSVEKKQLAKEISKPLSQYGGFKNNWLKYMKSDASLGSKFMAGVPRVFGGNPATRVLMRKTKWYLGLLDWLGIANFVGPDELVKTVPDLEKKEMEYNRTTEAQNLWNQEMGGVNVNSGQSGLGGGNQGSMIANPTGELSGSDPILQFFSSLK